MECYNDDCVVRVESQLNVAERLRHVVYRLNVMGNVIPPGLRQPARN
jgi:hypothetical protein